MGNTYEFSMTKKVVFGSGAVEKINDYLNNIGVKSALVVTDPFLLEGKYVNLVTDELDKAGFKYEVFTDVLPSPTQANAEHCGQVIRENKLEAVIAFGGGSSMDVAKGGALLATNPFPINQYVGTNLIPNPAIPIITIPTTAGTGSEVSNITILKNTETQVKAGIASPFLFPTVALIEPKATLSMPPRLTAATGMDALCHAIEGYSSLKGSPFTEIFYENAIKLISENLRDAVANGQNLTARENMSLAATLAGIGMANAYTHAVHAMSYSIESKYHAHHGESCASLLPSALKYSALADCKRHKKIAVLMGENVEGLSLRCAALKSVEAVTNLMKDIHIRTAGQLGLQESDIDGFAEAAFANKRLMGNNPWRATAEDLKNIYRDALSL